MSWIKKIVRSLTYFTFLLISVTVILEVIFRVLPTTSPVDLKPVTSEKDILRFKIDQTAVISLGANFYKTVTKNTNNVGFYSSFNYEKAKSPKIMIIGDSYIEAAQIKNSDTIGEVLVEKKIRKIFTKWVCLAFHCPSILRWQSMQRIIMHRKIL